MAKLCLQRSVSLSVLLLLPPALHSCLNYNNNQLRDYCYVTYVTKAARSSFALNNCSEIISILANAFQSSLVWLDSRHFVCLIVRLCGWSFIQFGLS